MVVKRELAQNAFVEWFAYGYAALLTIMAAGQLVDFAKFVKLIQSNHVIENYSAAVVVAIAIVGFEIFAIPFLLRVAARRTLLSFSALFLLLVPVLWLILIARTIFVPPGNYGLLGPYVHIGGWWMAVALDVCLFVASILTFVGLGGDKFSFRTEILRKKD